LGTLPNMLTLHNLALLLSAYAIQKFTAFLFQTHTLSLSRHLLGFLGEENSFSLALELVAPSRA
jgi:hypothetical protein